MSVKSASTRWRSDSFLSSGFLLEMVPDKFVRIQLRGVSRQEVQFEPTFQALHVARHALRDMRRMAVQDQYHRALAAAHEVRQQLNELARVQPFSVDLEPEFAQRIDRRDPAHPLPLASGRHLPRVAAR